MRTTRHIVASVLIAASIVATCGTAQVTRMQDQKSVQDRCVAVYENPAEMVTINVKTGFDETALRGPQATIVDGTHLRPRNWATISRYTPAANVPIPVLLSLARCYRTA